MTIVQLAAFSGKTRFVVLPFFASRFFVGSATSSRPSVGARLRSETYK